MRNGLQPVFDYKSSPHRPGTYRASVQDACDDPPPATVSAYQQVYGRNPDGWPPQIEEYE